MEGNKTSTTVNGGIGFCGLLTIVFIVLKLLGKIDWPWIWVLAPLWIDFIIGIILIIIAVVILIPKRKKKK